jgi:hypothetical protein
MSKALLTALAFFGSAYLSSSTGTPQGSTKKAVAKKSSSGTSFLDNLKRVAKYSYEGLFGKGGSLQQVSNTTIPARVRSPSVSGVQPVKATATQFYVPGMSNERLMSKAQIAAGNPLINAVFGKAMQYNPRVGRNITLKKPAALKSIKSRINPQQVYA